MAQRAIAIAAAAGSSLLVMLVAAAPANAQEHPHQPAGEPEFLDAGVVLPTGLPFSEAVRHDGVLYLSGMVGIVPGEDTLAAGGIEAEARQTMENIQTVLERYGSSMDRVIKCTIFLADIGEWGTFNGVYRTFFEEGYPARSALGASGLALDARVEVECIAAAGRG